MFPSFLDLPETVAPDYGGASLLNLSVSLACQLGRVPPGRFAAPACPMVPDLSDARVVVFLLIDGMGGNDVARRGAGAFMSDHRIGTLSSVFPSTTASAVTTSLTALAPAAHGLTGWYIRDERFGGILAPLPLVRRDRQPLTGWWRMPRLFPYPAMFQRMKCRSAVVSHEHIVGSPFNMRHTRGVARRYAYRNLDEMVDSIVQAARDLGGQGGFVYAYHADYDGLAHDFGIGSPECTRYYAQIDDALRRLHRGLAGQGAALVVTADHGFIDSPPERQLDLAMLPDIQACLDGPLWGERRVAYCRIRPGCHQRFEAAVAAALAGRFDLVPAARLIGSGVFGPAGKMHPRLADRVGDYALVAREDWTIYDRLPNERPHGMLGVHAGVSADEMLIPLVLARS
jgi:hypothetical protein